MAEDTQVIEKLEEGYVRDKDGNLVPDYEQTLKFFDDGDVVSGLVVRIDRDEVLVDIGYKSEGVIPSKELSIRKNAKPSEIVELGESIDALVLQKEDKDGRLILSKKRAEYEKAWQRIERMNAESEPITGTVIEVVKGGLILDIGLRGFLPASLVDVRRVKDLEQFIGDELTCKIIETDRNRNNVVLSRRAILDEERRADREKIMGSIEKGQLLLGKVSSIVDFGAFVDLGGLDGLIHISELSWNHVDHPSEIINVGDEVKVKVLDVDVERCRISLGLKQTQDDPWKQRLGNRKIGDTLTGKVVKIVNFGAFVDIGDGIEGLVHISEIAHQHVEKAEEVLNVGQEVSARIVDIDADRRRVSLSIKQTPPAPEKSAPAARPETESAEDNATDTAVEADVETVEPEAAAAVQEPAADVEGAEGDSEAVEEEVVAPKSKPKKEPARLKLMKKKTEDEAAAGIGAQPEPGSLEDVLQQMKESHGDKTD